MKLSKFILWVGSIIFVIVGALFIFSPESMPLSGVTMSTGPARSEIRAVYGGIEAGVGVFFALCALRSAWIQPGLAAAALVSGGAGIARFYGFAVEAVFDSAQSVYGTTEILGGIAALWALRRERLAARAR